MSGVMQVKVASFVVLVPSQAWAEAESYAFDYKLSLCQKFGLIGYLQRYSMCKGLDAAPAQTVLSSGTGTG